jgi:tyrosine-protein phosphatase SIW14
MSQITQTSTTASEASTPSSPGRICGKLWGLEFAQEAIRQREIAEALEKLQAAPLQGGDAIPSITKLEEEAGSSPPLRATLAFIAQDRGLIYHADAATKPARADSPDVLTVNARSDWLAGVGLVALTNDTLRLAENATGGPVAERATAPSFCHLCGCKGVGMPALEGQAPSLSIGLPTLHTRRPSWLAAEVAATTVPEGQAGSTETPLGSDRTPEGLTPAQVSALAGLHTLSIEAVEEALEGAEPEINDGAIATPAGTVHSEAAESGVKDATDATDGPGPHAEHVSAAPHYALGKVTVMVEGEAFVMPAHFGIVEPGVYRSAFPAPDSYPFLERLQLKTIVNFLSRLPIEYDRFIRSREIGYHHLTVKGNKDHCEEMSRHKVNKAIGLMLDTRAHPLLMHCRSGKHRTGAVVGCVRMLQGAPLDAACAEYVQYCQHKQRDVDKQFIERFDPRKFRAVAPPAEHLPLWLPRDCFERPSMLEVLGGEGIVVRSGRAAGSAEEAGRGEEIVATVVGAAVASVVTVGDGGAGLRQASATATTTTDSTASDTHSGAAGHGHDAGGRPDSGGVAPVAAARAPCTCLCHTEACAHAASAGHDRPGDALGSTARAAMATAVEASDTSETEPAPGAADVPAAAGSRSAFASKTPAAVAAVEYGGGTPLRGAALRPTILTNKAGRSVFSPSSSAVPAASAGLPAALEAVVAGSRAAATTASVSGSAAVTTATHEAP